MDEMLLVVASLILASFGLVYSSVNKDIERAISVKPAVHPEDNKHFDKVFCRRMRLVYLTPLIIVLGLVILALVPVFYRIVETFFSAAFGNVSNVAYSYDPIQAIFTLVFLIMCLLEYHLISQAYCLSRTIKRLEAR